MAMQNLLVELFVEELPPKALKKPGEAFAGVLRGELVARPDRREFDAHCHASPRCLARISRTLPRGQPMGSSVPAGMFESFTC